MKNKKLWRAILEGCKYKGQAFGKMFRENKSCAFGAAMDGGNQFIVEKTPVFDRLPSTKCPSCRQFSFKLSVIAHLNDDHRWTREAIAEWVKTLEDQIVREKWEARRLKRESKETKKIYIKETEYVAAN